jgi:N4-gp56 family major capsid protein
MRGDYMKLKRMLKLNLRLFDGTANTNVTGDAGMTVEMKTFYDKNLIRNVEPELVHDQWAQTRDIPKNGGKKIEFRKYDALPKATTPLTEGVTPDGKKMSVTKVEAEVKQYGDYIALSDVLMMTAIDNNIVEASENIGSQAGKTLDTISRETLNAGTNVQYAEGQVTSRATITEDMKLTVKAVKMAVRFLKTQNAKKINGYFYGIVHQDCAFDLTEDDRFIEVVKYKNPERIYNGEIGEIEGVKFVETTESKKFTEAGASGIDVYSTLIFGANAYATTKVQGGGLETIIKQSGSAGTADPLNQRATVGWKALKVTEILSQQYMIRIETASTFNDHKSN